MKKYRIVTLGIDEKNGRYIQKAFELLGHETISLGLNFQAATYFDLEMTLESIRPDFVVARNMDVIENGPSDTTRAEEFQKFFERNRFPFFIWYQNSPETTNWPDMPWHLSNSAEPSGCVFGVVDSSFLEFFTSKNLKAFHLPAGVPDEILEYFPIDSESPADSEIPLSFSGYLDYFPRPLSIRASCEEILISYQQRALDELDRNLIRVIEAEPADKIKVREKINSSFQKLFADLPRSSAHFFQLRSEFLGEIESLFQPIPKFLYVDLFEILESCCTFAKISDFAARSSLRVFGTRRWRESWLEYSEETPRLEYLDLLKLYRKSAVNFCHTKWQFANSLHERPFQILAAGGLPLIDYRQDLSKCFESDEILTYENADEARELAFEFAFNNQARRERIQKGRKRVLENHLYSHRAEKIVQLMQNHFSI